MGLFSGSKKVYSGGLVLSPIFKEKANVIKDTMISSIFQSTPLTESLTAAHLNGFNSRVAKYLSYGKQFYTNGLPEGDKSFGYVNPTNVKVVLDELVGTPVTIVYADVSEPDYARYAAEYCQKTYGWNYLTNELANPPSGVKPVKLAGASNDGTTLSMKFSHSPKVIYVTNTSYDGSMGMGGMFGSTQQVTVYSYFSIDIPLDIDGLSYHVEYTKDNDLTLPKKIYLWNYSSNLNTYPILSNTSSYKYESQYYPIVPFRRNRANLKDSPTSPLFITGNKMLKKVGMTMNDLTKGLGSDTRDIDEAFFLFALNINTTLEEGKEYWFKYWKEEYTENSNILFDALPKTVLPSKVDDVMPASKTISISDAEFNVKISYSGINRFISKRVIGKINKVKLTKVILPVGTVVNTNISGGGMSAYAGLGLGRTYERSYIIIEKQISATEIETIQVFGLTHRTVIAGVTYWKVNSTLSTGSFFIPVAYDIVKSFSGIDESKILMESASILIYWTNVQKVKTGGFFGGLLGNKIFSIIVMVVVSVVSAGGLTAALAQLSTMTLTQVVTQLAVSIAVSYGLKKLGEIGGIFAVIAAVYGMYHFKVGVFSQNSATLAEPTWAENLLNAVTMISDQFNNLVAIDMKELMEDVGDFLKTVKEKTAELEAAQDLLDNSREDSFDPLSIVRQYSYFNPEESPTAYFNRTLNTNPGVASLDYTSIFVSVSLSLPTFNELNEVGSHNEYVYNG
jgi:hypothetical protein